jgi:AcrR family transcriptional regulator
MRVTVQAKAETRRRILDAARACFTEQGFEAATTRDIAAAAGIAAGTLFNYFAAKEAMATALVAEALGEARSRLDGPPDGETLDEALFALIAGELRSLRPHRAYLRPVLETALSPLAGRDASPEADALRVAHLEEVGRLIAAASPGTPPSPLALSLYWTLYTGVLAFWASDESPHQEATLAILDHYLKAFVGSLSGSA